MRRALVMLALAAVLVACSGGGDSVEPTVNPTVEPTAAATPDGDRIILEWTREGGIAGFCDGMTVTANHRASLGTCEDPSAELTGQLLPVDWIGQLEAWRGRVASFELTQANPPGTADGMEVRLRFEGRGAAVASEAEQQEIANFSAELFNALKQAQQRVRVRSPDSVRRIATTERDLWP